MLCSYFPLIQADPILRRPIVKWRSNLLQQLRQQLHEVEPDIATPLNQLALLEAYQGNQQDALLYCQLQIQYWCHLAKQRGDPHYLSNAVQPWINTFRLQRWQQNEGALLLYQQLSPEQRGRENCLNRDYQIAFTLEELLNFPSADDKRKVLDSIYWIEYGKLLLAQKKLPELKQEIQKGLQSGLRYSTRMRLLELWFGALCQRQEFTYALSSLQRMALTSGAYALEFKVLEFILLCHLSAAETADYGEQLSVQILTNKALGTDAKSVYLLSAICKVFQQLGTCEQQLALFRKLRAAARMLGDEVLMFEAEQALCRLGDIRAVNDYQDSHYLCIRRQLTLAPQAAFVETGSVKAALQALARLDYRQSLSLLNVKADVKSQFRHN